MIHDIHSRIESIIEPFTAWFSAGFYTRMENNCRKVPARTSWFNNACSSLENREGVQKRERKTARDKRRSEKERERTSENTRGRDVEKRKRVGVCAREISEQWYSCRHNTSRLPSVTQSVIDTTGWLMKSQGSGSLCSQRTRALSLPLSLSLSLSLSSLSCLLARVCLSMEGFRVSLSLSPSYSRFRSSTRRSRRMSIPVYDDGDVDDVDEEEEVEADDETTLLLRLFCLLRSRPSEHQLPTLFPARHPLCLCKKLLRFSEKLGDHLCVLLFFPLCVSLFLFVSAKRGCKNLVGLWCLRTASKRFIDDDFDGNIE